MAANGAKSFACMWRATAICGCFIAASTPCRPGTFDRPTGVAIAPNGDIFVSDGHDPNAHNSARIVKFSPDGKFIKAWGRKGSAPGEFDEPHDIFIGGTQNRLYVADRRNNRI